MADTPQPSEPAQQRPLPGARVALVLLLCINLFNYIDRQVLAAVVPDIEKEFFPPEESANQGATAPAFLKAFITFLAPAEKSYAKAMMGLLATAFMLTYMITAPLFGWLAERYSRWVLIGIGVILWSLASGASGLAETFTLLLLTRCLVGVGEGAYGPAAPTLIADLYPARMRSTVLGWFYMAIPVGSALGYVLGGAVASIKEGAWRWSFYLVVVPGILLGVWAFTMREPRRGQTAASGAPKPHARLRDYRTFLLTPSYILNTLGMTAMTFAVGGIAYWMPYYILREKGQESLALARRLLPDFRPHHAARLSDGPGSAVGAVALVLGLHLLLGVLPVLQYRPDQHHPGQRHSSRGSGKRFRREHLPDPCGGRRHLAFCDWADRRLIEPG